jgi:hypothetical protein
MRSSNVLALALTFLGAISSTSAHAIPAARSPSGYFPSVVELGWCLVPWHILDCRRGQGHADEASAAAQQLFPPASLHNGKGDAFRHCYWNARMTIDMGSDTAKTIADNHGKASDGPESEKRMDYANNESGRAYGRSAGGNYATAKEFCRVAATNGKLVTLK